MSPGSKLEISLRAVHTGIKVLFHIDKPLISFFLERKSMSKQDKIFE